MADEKDILRRLSDALDQSLLDAVKSKDCSAADRNVARARLKDLGIGPGLPDEGYDEISEAVAGSDNVMELPKLDREPDEALKAEVS